MTRTRVFAILVAAVLFVACSSSTPSEPEPGRLRFEASLASSVAIGERVPITLTVLNETNAPVRLQFPTSCQVDLVIEQSGVEVWSLMSRSACALGVTVYTLEPSQSFRYPLSWDQSRNDGGPPRPGLYTVRGILQEGSLTYSEPKFLTVRP
jgi:intracellular proteinase inhibitor BsuPI